MTKEEIEKEFKKAWADMHEFVREGEGWHGHVYGYTPVQADGEVDGHPWFFRSRWHHWYFKVAPVGKEPSDVGGGPHDVEGWFIESSMPCYWNMEHDEAWDLIEASIVMFRAHNAARAKVEAEIAAFHVSNAARAKNEAGGA